MSENMLPDLRAQLVRTAERDAGGIPAERARLPTALAVVASVLVALSVAGIVLLGHSSHGGSPVSHATAGFAGPDPYVSPADPAMPFVHPVIAADGGCVTPRRAIRAPQARMSNALPAALQALLGVLRRSPGPEDRLPHAIAQIDLTRVGSVVFVRAIRLARVVDGVRYYLVPIRTVPTRPLSAACVRAARTALERRIARLSPGQKVHARAVLNAILADEQYRTRPRQGICLTAVNPSGRVSNTACGASALDVAHQGMLSNQGGRSPDVLVFTDVLPDGVSRVRFKWRTLSYQGAHSVTAPVINNVLVTQTDILGFPDMATWYDASGRVIRAFALTPPSR